eukprot:6065360-Amphidinium_carterae.2
MLSREGSLVHELLYTKHLKLPYRMFILEATGAYLSNFEWSQLPVHAALSLSSLATSIAPIESLHASIRRQLHGRVQTLPVQFDVCSAEWVWQVLRQYKHGRFVSSRSKILARLHYALVSNVLQPSSLMSVGNISSRWYTYCLDGRCLFYGFNTAIGFIPGVRKVLPSCQRSHAWLPLSIPEVKKTVKPTKRGGAWRAWVFQHLWGQKGRVPHLRCAGEEFRRAKYANNDSYRSAVRIANLASAASKQKQSRRQSSFAVSRRSVDRILKRRADAVALDSSSNLDILEQSLLLAEKCQIEQQGVVQVMREARVLARGAEGQKLKDEAMRQAAALDSYDASLGQVTGCHAKSLSCTSASV